MAKQKPNEGDDWGAVLLAVLGVAAGIGGVAYGIDQQQKREQEAARFHHELGLWRAALAEKEAAFADLAARLGPKNEQVRLLAAEVVQLRAEVTRRERAA
jgi:hypothetical protein